MVQVQVNPDVLMWAVQQSGVPMEQFETWFPAFPAWLKAEKFPTVAQLESFARKAHVPFGYLVLREVPSLSRPHVQDFRTVGSRAVTGYSRNLLDTIRQMKERQAWLHEYKKAGDYAKVAFVGSLTKSTSKTVFLERMYGTIGLDAGWQEALPTKERAFQQLRDCVEEAGVVLFVNGIVGNDTHRPLDLQEFRGFALADDYAPLIFINGVDATAGKIFTLVHELVHLFLGRDGLDDGTEAFCNEMAASFLVPETRFADAWRQKPQDFEGLERTFKVSRLVLYRVALTRQYILKKQYDALVKTYEEEMPRRKRHGGGGDFYKVLPNRIGRSFSRYVFSAVQEGALLYREAYRLLGIHGNSFQHAMQEAAEV